MNYYSTNDTTVNTRIHQNTVDIIREIPITKIAENLGLELKKSGSGFVALCPFHQEKTPSFHLTDGKGFYCFGCGEGGDAIKLVQQLDSLSFTDAVLAIANSNNIPIEYSEKSSSSKGKSSGSSSNIKKNQLQSQPGTVMQVSEITSVDSINEEIELAKLDNNLIIDRPQVNEIKIGGLNEIRILYPYSEMQWVERIERYDTDGNRIKFKLGQRKEDDKQIVPHHIDSDGKIQNSKGSNPWTFYRQDEAIAYGDGKWVLMVEGEKCVEVVRGLGLVSISRMGSDKSPETVKRNFQELSGAGILGIIFISDNDDAGVKECNKFSKIASEVQLPSIIISITDIWKDAPKGGDIADWVEAHTELNNDQFIQKIEIEIFKKLESMNKNNIDVQQQDLGELGSEITQEVERFLYGDKPWICVNGTLHFWTGTYYKASSQILERKRIANYLNKYPVKDPKTGDIIFPYAKPNFISQVLEWVKDLLGVDLEHERENRKSEAINCTNGILKIEWGTVAPNLHPIPKYNLIPHSPDYYFLYEPVVTFDPNANSEHCDKMLEALEPEQQDIFLKTIGASLDLATVRRFKGRSIKALLCKGHGSNGKDTLREAVAALYGYHGMTGAGLDDFAQYDSGRKFPLAKLIHSRVNWASENGNAASLDRLQSLKAAITGDTLSHERKGENESEFNPQTVLLFNINDVPRLGAALEAIKSRFAVLSFDKTYKVGADPSKGEIEADARFKYDPEWVKQNVLPAFLNRVLQGLTDLMTNGIDYTSTEKALDDIRCQNSHLWQFAADTGLTYNPDSVLSAQELWDKLEAWYLINGTLSYEENNQGKRKAVWEEPLNKFDKLIKSKNNVTAGFLKIFPKASRVVIDVKNGKIGIKGLCFSQSGTLRVGFGYDVGYENPYTEGLPGTSGTISNLRGCAREKEISEDVFLALSESEDDIDKSYPTYPEPLQDKENPTRQDTRNVPAEPLNVPAEPIPPSESLPDDYRPTLAELTSAEPLPSLVNLAVFIPFNSLKQGETLFDGNGKPHTLKMKGLWYWLTDEGLRIDKDNIGNFHRE